MQIFIKQYATNEVKNACVYSICFNYSKTKPAQIYQESPEGFVLHNGNVQKGSK